MARRCTTDNSPGLCCTALTNGVRSGQAFSHPDPRTGKMRCHVCTIVQRSKGRGQGFQHRYAKNSVCNIVSGCPVLSTTGGQPSLTFGQTGGVPSV